MEAGIGGDADCGREVAVKRIGSLHYRRPHSLNF